MAFLCCCLGMIQDMQAGYGGYGGYAAYGPPQQQPPPQQQAAYGGYGQQYPPQVLARLCCLALGKVSAYQPCVSNA